MPPIGAARAGVSRVAGTAIPDSGTAIPDSGGNHQWDWTANSGTVVSDQIGSLDADFTGINWQTGAGAGDVYGVLDGTDDDADLGTSAFTSFLNDNKGTISAWVRVDNQSRNYIFGAGTTSSDTLIIDVDTRSDSQFFARLRNGGTNADAFGGSPGSEVGNWINVSVVANGTDLIVYRAYPGDSYTVTQVDSASVPGTSSGGWGNSMHYGSDNGSKYLTGGVDLTFSDTVGRTESELQSWVDDTKQFYQ